MNNSQAIIDHCKGIRKSGIPSKGGIQETEDIKKILEKQLQLLSEESKRSSAENLCKLSEQMRAIAQILLGQSQSFYEASTSHPYVVQLPVKDLIDLYAARYKQAHSSGQTHEL